MIKEVIIALIVTQRSKMLITKYILKNNIKSIDIKYVA